MVDLDALSGAVGEHLDRLGIERTDWVRICKVAEEGGEVVGALVKRTQDRATDADVEDELADVMLAALAAMNQMGVSPESLIARRWADVSARTREGLTKSHSALGVSPSCLTASRGATRIPLA